MATVWSWSIMLSHFYCFIFLGFNAVACMHSAVSYTAQSKLRDTSWLEVWLVIFWQFYCRFHAINPLESWCHVWISTVARGKKCTFFEVTDPARIVKHPALTFRFLWAGFTAVGLTFVWFELFWPKVITRIVVPSVIRARGFLHVILWIDELCRFSCYIILLYKYLNVRIRNDMSLRINV